MDNLVTPRFMVSGLQLPMPVSFLSFLFWSWVFGFLGGLLAIPATLFVRALLASGREAHLFANFLSDETPDEAQTNAVVPAGIPATATDPASRPVRPG